jgi:hypothetical protein
MISECCGYPVKGEVMFMGEGMDAVGICSCCGEWMGCYDEDVAEAEDERES